MKRRAGIVVATAAASLILAGAIAARAEQEKAGGELVHCAGVNECKGKGICAGPESECAGVNTCKGKGICAGPERECAGVNTCKGKGVIATTAEECQQKGGKIVDKQM